MTNAPLDIQQAIEVFVRGFAFGRSFTHPFVPEKIEHGVWLMRDAERSGGSYRSEEYVAHGVNPADMLGTAQAHTRGSYKICAIRREGEPESAIRNGYRELGCRLLGTEPFMVHRLQSVPDVDSPVAIVRVSTAEEAGRLARAARSRQILPEHLCVNPPPMRQYMALDGERPVGWVGSVAACGAAWCSSMFVEPEVRRRGIARALMTRMLMDDRDAGASSSVLLASRTGAKLYDAVGYERMGHLYLFSPPRRDARNAPSLDSAESAEVE